MGMRNRLIGAVLVASGLCALSGCVREVERSGEHVFRYELWVPLTALLGGMVAAPAGWALRRRSARLGWGLLILGPIAVFGVAPSLLCDRVSVDAEGFHVRTGIWGVTAVHDVKYDDVGTIRITAEQGRSRRGTHTNYYMNCDRKSGGSSKVPMSNAVTQASVEAILDGAKAHGILIVDGTGNP
jgi:hypothetical protein